MAQLEFEFMHEEPTRKTGPPQFSQKTLDTMEPCSKYTWHKLRNFKPGPDEELNRTRREQFRKLRKTVPKEED